MEWFKSKSGESAASPTRAEPETVLTKYGSPMRNIPSFNDFLGDNPGMELEAENKLQKQQQQTRDQGGMSGSGTGHNNTGPLAATPGAPGTKPGDINPWRSVFDPGYNPNMHRVGRQCFDTVTSRMGEPSVWEYIIKAEQLNKKSFEAMERGAKGYLEREDLAAAFDSKYGDAGRLVDQADANKDGRIDKGEFHRMVDDLTSQGGVAWTE